MRIIVAMTGATGAVVGIRLLERLSEIDDVETHLITSKWARLNIRNETRYTVERVESLADVVYTEGDQSAAVSSGSFRVDAMVVAPCSMRTLAAIRHGLADNLITRAADVVLKERRNLCLVPRETPLSAIHLDNMLALARMGVGICPPMPAFYNHPASVDDIIDHIAVRTLDQLGVEADHGKRWTGLSGRSDAGVASRSAQRPTLMWEAAAIDGETEALRQWVKTELQQLILGADPYVQFEIYFNDSRVVVVATGDVEGVEPPAAPPGLARRDAHVWRFVREDNPTIRDSVAEMPVDPPILREDIACPSTNVGARNGW